MRGPRLYSLLFWILWILTILAYFFGSQYPMVSFGMLMVLIGLLGWKICGPPIQRG